jgi:hypothetical protein
MANVRYGGKKSKEKIMEFLRCTTYRSRLKGRFSIVE